jgi:uncharacterized protein (DUF2336 family)
MSSLTRADVEKLLAQPLPEVRAELAEKLGSELDNEALSLAELGIAQDIIRILASDIEEVVRANLAHSLRHSPRLPHDVAMALANDIDRVAMPVLSDSPVLTPADLIAVVREQSAAKQKAIAGRRDLPEEVSDALISEGHPTAVSALMRNASAEISERGFGVALQRFGANEAVKEGMVRRERLPLTVAERLVTLVSDHLRTYLVAHHELSPSIAADLVLQSRDLTTIRLAYGRAERELERLAREMHRSGRLTPFLVLRALCLGDMAFFEAAMAVLAGVPTANARRLIADGGPNGLRALFDRAGLPDRLFPAMRVAVDVVRGVPFDGDEREIEAYRAQILPRILTQFEQFDAEDLEYLVDRLIASVQASVASREEARD